MMAVSTLEITLAVVVSVLLFSTVAIVCQLCKRSHSYKNLQRSLDEEEQAFQRTPASSGHDEHHLDGSNHDKWQLQAESEAATAQHSDDDAARGTLPIAMSPPSGAPPAAGRRCRYVLCTSEFERVEESLTTTATEEAAAAAIAADIAEAEAREAAGLGPAQDEASDMALAIQLQREEEEQAQLAEQQMQQMQLQREQALAAQQGYGPAGPAPAYPGQPYRQQQQQQQPPQQQQRGNCLLQ